MGLADGLVRLKDDLFDRDFDALHRRGQTFVIVSWKCRSDDRSSARRVAPRISVVGQHTTGCIDVENRAGAIPGARNLEWKDLIDQETHRFKNPDELRRLFRKAGIALDRPTASHCQSGGRASVMAFGLELMGADDVRNYYRGWSEWGNLEHTPVVVVRPKN